MGLYVFVAFTAVVLFYGMCELDVCGVHSVCIVYGVFGMDVCGVHSVCSIYEAFGLIVFLWRLECL